MALPSQTFGSSRFSATRRPVIIRKRRGKRLVAYLALIAVIAAGAWLYLAPEENESRMGAATGAGGEALPRNAGKSEQPLARSSLASAERTRPETTPIAAVPEPLTRSQPAAGDPVEGSGAIGAAGNGLGAASFGTEPAPVENAAAPTSEPAPDVARLIAQGRGEWEANRPVRARDTLNRALHHSNATEAQKSEARAMLMRISELLTFSPRVVNGDPMSRVYEIQSGDSLGVIARNEGLLVDWRLLMRINNIQDPRRIRVGQNIKLLQGPFHAVISKTAYRMDVYSDFRDSYGNRLYITSFPCGLGEYDSTPEGMWVVRQESKLINPHWINPRTREEFDADDPENPIGERWIGLKGIDEQTRDEMGYGIHGTIEPESIGQQKSMGCVRLLPDDVELAYELLFEGESTVEIVP